MGTKPGKTRLDVLLVERGLAASRERAQALLLAGYVRVNGQKMEKAGSRVALDAQVELAGEPAKYASRGGEKLEGALEDFGISPEGRICLDVGSSSGGFTDCLLQHGAKKVYAVDVTPKQMDWKLQQDSRVVLLEKNARYLKPEDVPEAAELIVMDVSFISATKVIPAIAALGVPAAILLILVKPQFELERGEVGKGGIVRETRLHEKAIERVRRAAEAEGLDVEGMKPSRLTGAEGNQEFFLLARRRG
ncbi:MAG TPA: TlyA family RNA methyltransferase [Candidatus Acidoferrum sp.]|nr:TlyA family RNA methyltransferase [Candidatus Acidoferrum sp.]